MLRDRGYQLYATEGTHKYFMENGVENSLLHWPDEEDRHPNTVEFLREKKIDLVINIPKNYTKRELRNGYQIRRSAIDYNIPLITNSRVASAFVYAICKYAPENLTIKSWGEY
jgi:carbamoyl-phosphate synthase large subunit